MYAKENEKCEMFFKKCEREMQKRNAKVYEIEKYK